jgi:hypothetical protein
MRRRTKIILISFFILAIFLVLVINFNLTGNFVNSKNSKPSPRVLSAKCEKIYMSNTPKIELRATVKNFGDDGEVTVVGEIDAENNEFDDSATREIFLKSGESENVIFYFDAENIISAKCPVRAFAS